MQKGKTETKRHSPRRRCGIVQKGREWLRTEPFAVLYHGDTLFMLAFFCFFQAFSYNYSMKKKCAISGVEFEITERDREFYRKLDVPEPTLCPDERARRRMAIRNERNLYHTKSSRSGLRIFWSASQESSSLRVA